MKYIITIIFSILLVQESRSQPERVWKVQPSPETSNPLSGQSVQYPNSKPYKIRLVNYEQMLLANRNRESGKGYLETVRQKARGVQTRPVQSGIPIAPITKNDANQRLPDLDSLHQARNLFDTKKPESTSLSPLNEFEIKSDYQLQKSMQRTTVSTRIYPTTASIDGETNSEFTTLPTPTSANPPSRPQTVEPVTVKSIQTSTQGFNSLGFPPNPPPVPVSVSSSIQYEQLGCGFDLLTNSCKDVFGFGWCNSCEDFGNVFLHDCKCTIPNKNRNISALATSTIDPVIAAAIAANNQQLLQQQQLLQSNQQFVQNPHIVQPQLQQQPLIQYPQQSSSFIQQGPQQQLHNEQQHSGIIHNYFVPPTFFGI